MTNILRTTHNWGFFSCCSVRLDDIVKYFNKNERLPDIVDSSEHFGWYKGEQNNIDITFRYFAHYDNNTIKIDYHADIDYMENYQYNDYSTLKYEDISPFIRKYFSPSDEIRLLIEELEVKYNLNYENICVLFYRGNDKITETKLCSYDEYIKYAQEVLVKNPDVRFFIQSDETEFIETMTALFPSNSFYMSDEIRHMRKCINTVDLIGKFRNDIVKYSKLYLAITIIMSKCKYIICGSGNCSIWIMFYRGNHKNMYQNNNGQWIISK